MGDSNDSVQANRIPVLTSSNYDNWKGRMYQYMLQTNYGMWKVVKTGAKTVALLGPDAKSKGVATPSDPPSTEQERRDTHNECQALSTLLIAIPNEYQHQFRNFTDAKLLWEALEKRFGGTESTRRNQKDLLKQQFENFVSIKGETLSQTFDRYNKLIGELSILGEQTAQDAINRKFLRSLGEEWTIYTVSYRQGNTIDTMELDELYNELRVFEP